MTTTNGLWKKETNKMEQNLPITTHDVTFWTRWNELLFPKRSAKVIDGSEKWNRWVCESLHVIKTQQRRTGFCQGDRRADRLRECPLRVLRLDSNSGNFLRCYSLHPRETISWIHTFQIKLLFIIILRKMFISQWHKLHVAVCGMFVTFEPSYMAEAPTSLL